jgi:hypothetical protein
VLAAVRITLGVLGVMCMIAGGGFMRYAQHAAHVERAAADAREAHDHVERVRAAGRRLYTALDEPDGVFRMLATAKVHDVAQQISVMRDASEGMAAARRDFLAAAAAYRDVTQSSLGDDEKRLAHADELFIDSFVETRAMVEVIAARPMETDRFRNARDHLQSSLGNALAEYRSARTAVLGDVRTALEASRARADLADREPERLQAQPLTEALLHP